MEYKLFQNQVSSQRCKVTKRNQVWTLFIIRQIKSNTYPKYKIIIIVSYCRLFHWWWVVGVISPSNSHNHLIKVTKTTLFQNYTDHTKRFLTQSRVRRRRHDPHSFDAVKILLITHLLTINDTAWHHINYLVKKVHW